MTISRIRISFFIIPLLFSQGVLAHEQVKKCRQQRHINLINIRPALLVLGEQ